MSCLTSTVCAPRSGTSALTSCTSRSPVSTIGQAMRRRSPPPPHATVLPTPSPTPDGSAIDARCPMEPTPSASHSSFSTPESRHASASSHCRIHAPTGAPGPGATPASASASGPAAPKGQSAAQFSVGDIAGALEPCAGLVEILPARARARRQSRMTRLVAGGQIAASAGRRSDHGDSASIWAASESSVLSWSGLPTIWTARGRPWDENPAGTEAAG